MKKLLLLLSALLLISCSEDEEPERELTPEDLMFQIKEGETKVEFYTLHFEGQYQVNYKIIELVFDAGGFEIVDGEIKDSGSFLVDGNYDLEIEDGFDAVELEFSNITEEGTFKVTLNENKEYIPMHMVDENNLSPEFYIPYKY